MPYGRSRLTASAQLGDPFLGGIIRGIGRAAGGFLRGGPLGALGAIITPQIRTPVSAIPGSGTQFIGPPRPTALRQPPRPAPGSFNIMGAAGALPGRPVGQRRRRMNPLNVKALRRSTRRLAGFQREAKKVEKQLRKIAPQRRSSRRDLGPGHRHIR